MNNTTYIRDLLYLSIYFDDADFMVDPTLKLLMRESKPQMVDILWQEGPIVMEMGLLIFIW